MALARELSLRLPLQRGDDVRAVQQALIRAGMLAGSADGIFGPATHRAVLDFQRRMPARHPGVAADGCGGNARSRAWRCCRLARRAAPLCAAPDGRQRAAGGAGGAALAP